MEADYCIARTKFMMCTKYVANKECQYGFILVTVMFFLSMISLLVLNLLNSTHLELRMSQNYAMASQQFQAAEAGLKKAEARLAHTVIENTLEEKLNYADYTVYYAIQRLHVPFCIGQQSAYYYQITAQA